MDDRRRRTVRGDYFGEYFGEGKEGDWDWRNSGPYTGIGPKSYQRPDHRILREVCERITRHGLINARDISVTVDQGEVTLSGSVKSRREKRMTEDVAESVSGVRDIHNHLRLQAGTAGSGDRGDRWKDRVGRSGVYPVSEMEDAPADAEVQGMSSWGQGERGAEGYHDSGESELNLKPEQGPRHENP